MALYIIKSAITLALLYSCFFFFMSKETFHRFNRIMLLGIMIVSLIVPLIHFTTEHPTIINEEFQLMETMIDNTDIGNHADYTERTASLTWLQVIEGLYILGVIIMLLLTATQSVLLINFVHRSLRHTDDRGNTIVLHQSEIPPFSFFHYIVMNVNDYENHRQYILTHEKEHIRLKHSYDLLLLEAIKIFQWFNPFIWFISSDLKILHEYEADQAVINQGIDAKTYQQLLVMKAIGNRLQPFTNNLNHGSLKKRILMMYKKPSNQWFMLKALCAIPVVALALHTFATPNNNNSVEDIVTALDKKEIPVITSKSEENTAPLLIVDGEIIDIPQHLKLKTPIEDEDVKSFLASLNIKSNNDVISVTFLESATATAIWGSQGTNGAIEIKTKLAANPTKVVTQTEKHEETKIDNDDDDMVREICEESAKYEGGDGALMQFIAQNIRYPKEAAEHGIEGRVIVSFIINKDGSCSNFKVVTNTAQDSQNVPIITAARKAQIGIEQGINVENTPEEIESWGKSLETEALRVLSLMGKWQPARHGGKAVRQKWVLPLTFRLQ